MELQLKVSPTPPDVPCIIESWLDHCVMKTNDRYLQCPELFQQYQRLIFHK